MSIEKFFALYLALYLYYGTLCVITKHSGLIEITDTVLYALVPIVVTILANVAIIYKLMYIKYKGISHTNESVSKSSTRGSVIVVTVSLAFIILTSPRAVDSALEQYISVYPFCRLFVISMQYSNHAINGILYYIFGEKFRNEFLKIMLSCRKETRQNISISMNLEFTDTTTANPVGCT